uniref:Uncharacterized protein n=1 Tax=Arundo donax TaxID=35708 RepID=A0A0A9EFG4_ARUDO
MLLEFQTKKNVRKLRWQHIN